MVTDELLAATVQGATTDRVVATIAAFVALAGAILGATVLVRPHNRRSSAAALVAAVAGVTGVVVGGLVVALADGGPGTGNGIVGGYAALVLGAFATVSGGVALARIRRTGLAHGAGRPPR